MDGGRRDSMNKMLVLFLPIGASIAVSPFLNDVEFLNGTTING